MTSFWKEERYGYDIYQNEQKQIFLALTTLYPSRTLDAEKAGEKNKHNLSVLSP